ncbi:FG-GAP-like repeat-containing protein [Fibrella aestuarina]|nr:FG-GAP-like repeat-containing protein [Fibrella aestuarina]
MLKTVTHSFSLFLLNLIVLPSYLYAQAPTLGTYLDATMINGGGAVITPNGAPTRTSRLNVSTTANFRGTLVGDPATGVVQVMNAQPTGVYSVTVTGLGAGTAKRVFTLTVGRGPVCSEAPMVVTAEDVGVGELASAIALGDVNNDGNLDLLTANILANTVTVRLGDGTGRFTGTTDIAVGAGPSDVQVGDINNDGKLDFLAVNSFGNSVSVRLGDGTGQFRLTQEVSVGVAPQSIALADFNNDGALDFVTANTGNVFSPPFLSVRMGSGFGEFIAYSNASIPGPAHQYPGASHVVVLDINKDGNSDFLASSTTYNRVLVRLGNGVGGFTAIPDVVVGSGRQYRLAVGTLNNDNILDFVAADYDQSVMHVQVGVFGNTFVHANTISVGKDATDVDLGDFMNDGSLDAIACSDSLPQLLLGTGTGSFTPTSLSVAATRSAATALGDVNKDGRLDILTASYEGRVVVRLGSCNTAPVAVANANQSATVGSAFSYTVNAFTDAHTPNSLTYSASISPANGLTFNPTTRVISGIPTASGSSTVTVRATDPGSLSASTAFTITACPGYTATVSSNPACVSQRLTLGVQAASSYRWQGPAGFSSTQQNPPLSLSSTNQSGIYSVTVSSGANCIVTASVNLTVNAPSPDYTALADLYAATNGTGWATRTNWLAGCNPCGWYGVGCDGNGRVTSLVLGNNQLSGSLPASLSTLTSLTTLALDNNQLTGSLPDGLRALTGLTSLSLGGNQFSGTIPVSLTALSNLESLNLERNQLTGSMPANLGTLRKLSYLNLSRNQLTGSLPESLATLPSLTTLILSNNRLSGCIPNSYSALCGKSVNLTQNPDLPGSGDFGAFCATRTGGCSAPVAIVRQPNPSYTLPVGATLTVSISATGDVTGYQWYKNETALAGATSATLTLPSLTTANAGTYKVLVSGLANSVYSNTFTLQVIPTTGTDLYTLKDGAWNDASIWSLNRVPTSADSVAIKHLVDVPANYEAQARQVRYDPGRRLRFNTASRLLLGQR